MASYRSGIAAGGDLADDIQDRHARAHKAVGKDARHGASSGGRATGCRAAYTTADTGRSQIAGTWRRSTTND
jgi:hypothetical protein